MNVQLPARQFSGYLTPGLFFVIAFTGPQLSQSTYFPPPGNDWQKHLPEQAQMDAARLKEPVNFAVANETKAPHDMELAQTQTFGREPFGENIGVNVPRGAMTGIILRKGYLITEWYKYYLR